MTAAAGMTAEAKRALSTTIRAARAELLKDMRAATESAYRLGIGIRRRAGLTEERLARRERLDAWVREQMRSGGAAGPRADADYLEEAIEEAAYTLLNRLVVLRLMEELKLRRPSVVGGGWDSSGYRDFRDLALAVASTDPTEGYLFLLRLVFEELEGDLPGLFGQRGVGEMIPVPAATLRYLVDAVNDPALDTCWRDHTTLGWVYQYWNDPRREALDEKLNAGGKVEPHEIASKTQMFTERYMVEWLLQNSLGATWMAMCRRHGWTPEVEQHGVLADLEQRRVEWRAKRETGEVELDALMPIRGEVEERWKYWVDQPIPQDAVDKALDSIRDLKLIDPACGSGHFLVIAFDLLAPLYREEARHRGEEGQERWSDRVIAERILEHNLAGIDLDPRAVQIAAAGLWLKARACAPDASPGRMNLVASSLRLGALPEDDPARVELRRRVQEEVGLPSDLTDGLVEALAGADHIGSLLKIDAAIETSLEEYEKRIGRGEIQQGDLLGGFAPQQQAVDFEHAGASVLDGLESFLARHGGGEDLGLRLRGEQLAAGVRLVRLLREGQYDLVVGNPPYQSTSKMTDPGYVKTHYTLGKADLYAAFLLRGLELAREGGTSALLTMRNWMFIKQYAGLREHLLERYDLRLLGDFAVGAFDEVPNDVLSVVVSGFRRAKPADEVSVAAQPTPLDDKSYDRNRTSRKRAAVLAGVGRYEFSIEWCRSIDQWPIVYWWTPSEWEVYGGHNKLGEVAEVRQGLATANNGRFLRRPWECSRRDIEAAPVTQVRKSPVTGKWVPFIKGAAGRCWVEPLDEVIRWYPGGLAVSIFPGSVVRNPGFYFGKGTAFTKIGGVSARLHRYRSVFDVAGSSIFGLDPSAATCLLNRTSSLRLLRALNPTVNLQVGDVQRLAVIDDSESECVATILATAFGQHESHREPSVEYLHPGPSPWRYAQDWAQRAVDRPDGDPLPPYEQEHDDPPPTDRVSFGVGVALGRFGTNGKGILDDAPTDALPDGLLYISEATEQDSVAHPACAKLRAAWDEFGADIDPRRDLRTWLRVSFFGDVHRQMYENRPIHLPLSSANRSFVAFANIHRFTQDTLPALLANYLKPDLARLEGELADLRTEIASSSGATARRDNEKRQAEVQVWKDELVAFVAEVKRCAYAGAPLPERKTPAREVDARYVMDLDDGVLVNSAGLWPLLTPQWKDPKKWWKQLATAPARGNKDLDWSHLAARYFPARVDGKCRKDPSLAVAHGCFWKYHPERAYAWELRLQDEIGPDFTLDEQGSDDARAAFEASHPKKAAELEAAERKRREKKLKKKAKEQGDLFGGNQPG